MSEEKFFKVPPKCNPLIYVYEMSDSDFKGLLKVGYTTKGSAEERIKEQFNIKTPKKNVYQVVWSENAIKNNGETFTDHDVHKLLKKRNIRKELSIDGKKTEFFRCTVDDVKNAILSIKTGKMLEFSRTKDFKMRPEQEEAVKKTYQYFNNLEKEDPKKIPHFLWNAKMRFGKTFATYQLAKKMEWNRILILTFKPAVQDAWESDLKTHVDFNGWKFFSNKGDFEVDKLDEQQPIVFFGSFQDFLGKTKAGGIKSKNKWVHTINWDIVVLDEYHYGSWRENAKDLFEGEEKREQKYENGLDYYDEELMPITTKHYLYLSGTPFRAINSGEFIEEQIYNWTYSDEQKAKENWDYKKGKNPYESLPRMILMTYQLPEVIKNIALDSEYNEFSLNVFFKANGVGKQARFKYKDWVQKWLNLIRGGLSENIVNDLKLKNKKPPMPFSDSRLIQILLHTFWFLPNISSCDAMENLLKEKQNTFYHDYKIINASGNKAGNGVDALIPVYREMKNPLKIKTITLSCGKLTTGVTVKPWSGIFMLRDLQSPETYFQAAFRVQSPWTISDPIDEDINHFKIIKKECYVFDFAPDRALRQVAEYSCKLNVEEHSPEKKVGEFLKFLPILAYDGSSMKELNAKDVLDIASSGTSATLLARKWESALLVNVDNNTLRKLMDNKDAMEALGNIEGFRSLNQDIEKIINTSNVIKKIKREVSDEDFNENKRKELTQEEKELKKVRKNIQDKLIKFATRIPIFMYLTEYREIALKDVIRKLEPKLFKKVTGLNLNDFELLLSIGVFNYQLMNDAIYKFKRYEDSSLEYTGIKKHTEDKEGLFDTVILKDEYIFAQ